MYFTKHEVKSASKKLLSIVLAFTMMLTSVSVCFGTLTASAADVDYKQSLADLINDNYELVENAGKGTYGSTENRVTTLTLPTYDNYVAMRDILIALDGAIKASKQWQKTTNTTDSKDTQNCTDTKNIYSEITQTLQDYGVTVSDNIGKFLKFVLEWSGATLHASANSSSDSVAASYSSTINVKTEDYKGYLTDHTGDYTTVEDSIALGYTYTFTMGRGFYAVQGQCSSTNYYHNMVWPADYPINAPSANVNNGDVKSTLNTYASYINTQATTYTFDKMASMTPDAIDTVLNEIEGKKNTIKSYVNEGETDNYSKLFGDIDKKIDKIIEDSDSAKAIASYSTLASEAKNFIANHNDYGTFNWGGFDEATIKSDYNTFINTYYNPLIKNPDVYNYFKNAGYYTDEYYTNFHDNVAAFDLEDLRLEKIDPFYNQYALSFPMEDGSEGISVAEKQIAYSDLSGYLANVYSYTSQVQAAIFPEGLEHLLDLQEKLECQVDTSVLYFAEHVGQDYSDVATEDVIAEIKTAKTKLSNLNGLKNSVDYVDNLTLLDEPFENADTFIDYLYSLLAERFSNEVIAADELYNELERPKKLDIAAFSKMNVVMKNLEDNIYEYLVNEAQDSRISADVLSKYNALKTEFYDVYNAFLVDRGFNQFKPTDIKIYRDDDIDEFFRENDDHNDDGKGDYEVTENNVEKIIDILEAALKDEKIASLLGSLINKDENGNPTGEPFDIGSLISGLLDGIYSDALLNTIIQFVYPAVSNEFVKVWATLPNFLDMPDMKITDDYSGDVYVNLYIDSVESATEGLSLPLFPTGLAAAIKQNYPQFSAAADILAKATTKARCAVDADNKAIPETLVTPWTDAVLFTNKTDADGNVIYDDEGNTTQVLALDWGIDEAENKKERFLEAASAALYGLEPLLLAILCNKEMSRYDNYVGYGEGTLNDLTIYVTVNNAIVYGRSVNLTLSATANDGYNNVIAPLFELLGVKAPNGRNFNSVRDVLEKGLLEPLDKVIEKLEANPIRTILDILPNLAYAAEADLLLTKLDYLETLLKYSAGAVIDLDLNPSNLGSLLNTAIIGGLVAGALEGLIEGLADGVVWSDNVIKNFVLTDVYKGELEVKLAEFLDIGSLLGGVDLSNFAGLWGMITGLIGMDLPCPDAALLSTLGELVEIDTVRSKKAYTGGTDGKAYHIKANRADVLQYLLKYVLSSGLLSSLVAEPSELVATIFSKLEERPGDAVAAIVELFNQQSYPAKNYSWYSGTAYGENVLGNSANAIYLNPENDWTKEKAEYLYENIDELLTSVLTMAGVEFDLGATISDAINGLLTDKTLTSLAALLAKLDLNALLAGDEEADANEPETVEEGEEVTGGEPTSPALDVNGLVKDLLGIDLSEFATKYGTIAEALEADAEYVYDFGVDAGTRSFAAALSEMFAPLAKVLDFILEGGNLVITLGDEEITLLGSEGYNNGFIPLLEALGCDVKALEESDNALELVINTLVGRIETLIEGDVIKNIIDLLPGVLYYITSNGLSTSVLNLLQPVLVIVDTINPIVDVMSIINGIEIGEEGEKKTLSELLGGELNIERLDINFILKLVKSLSGLDLTKLANVIYDACYNLCVEYDSVSTLANQTTWKKGAYNANFDQADMLTVILSFVLEWATVEDNAAKLDEMLKTNGIIAALGDVFADVEIAYGTPNWAYWFENDADAFNAYIESGEGLPVTLAGIDWENIKNSDWDLETAKYFAENIDVLVDTVIGMINKDKADAPQTLSAILTDLVNGLVNAETVDTVVGFIANLLKDVDDNLLDAAGYLLDVDIVGLKSYKCEAEINSVSDFINELANVLDTYAGSLVNWLFFGDDYRFAKKSDNTDTIVINGGEGYTKGLAIVLEALGCEIPETATTKTVLGSLASRVEAILANPVDEVLGLLPNLIYFLNANGAGVAVSNILAPVYALLDKLAAFGLEVNLTDLIGIDLANLSLKNVVTIVEDATGLPLDAAEEILVGFCTGKISKATYGYKMEAAREDVITILFIVALELVSDDAFAAKLDEMLDTDIISALKTVFTGVEIEYTAPDWEYPLAENGTVDAMKYAIEYPNNWTEDTAKYVANVLVSDEFDALIAALINSNYTSLGDLLNDKVNVFTSENLQAVVDLITKLLSGIDDGLLEAAGVLLGADVVGLKAYKVPEGITSVKAFADELAYVLNTYAKGVVEWLLLGKNYTFFVNENENGVPVDLITINGANGYSEGLALLLEALGCEDLPAVEGNETEAIVSGVLASLANLIDEIFAKPIAEVVDLLPNLFYFLNANGVAAVVDNTLAAVTALLEKISVFGLDVDIKSLVNLKDLMGIADTDAKISLDNLTMDALLEAVSYMVDGLDLTLVKDVLAGFGLGNIAEYDSLSAKTAYKMGYATEFDVYDMVTVIANIVLLTLADEDNAEFVEGLVGGNVYAVITNLFNMGEVPVQEFNWQFLDKADSGEVITAFVNSELYGEYEYGTLYTEEKAQYIADNFGLFVDNIIYLLGINMNGESVDNLTELLNGLIDGSLYTSKNVVAIRNALAGVADGIAGLEVNGKNVGKYIVEVLRTSGIADLGAVATVNVPEFTEDKAQFVASLCDVIEPLYGLLKFVLADEDLSFFVKSSTEDAITLKGAEGYAYGIIPLLEALECNSDEILAPAEYYDAVDANADTLLTSILNPLLDRVDVILADPANELVAMLPNLIYFINSNGVDTVVKNTLNAVYAVLNAIEPVAKIDLYEIIGLDLSTLTFEKLFEMLLDLIADKTGYEFENLDASALAELSVGTLVSYESKNGKKAYKMVYSPDEEDEGGSAELVLCVERLLITFIMHENNREVLIGLLKDNFGMTEDGEKFLRVVLDSIAGLTLETQLGMDTALVTIYYLYYGLDIGANEATTGIKDLNAEWTKLLKDMTLSNDGVESMAGQVITDILGWDIFEDIINPDDGIAPNGFIAFFQKVANFFNSIIDFFKNLFG